MDDLLALRHELRAFAAARDWEQFHSPRNLLLALVGEVGELAAELQWVPAEHVGEHMSDATNRYRIEDEVADVLLYLVQFADVCDIDLAAAARAKLERNGRRFPSDTSAQDDSRS